MRATKITIETDENVRLVLEGDQAQNIFNQVRWALYTSRKTKEDEALSDRVHGELAARYQSPYAYYIPVTITDKD